jgi:hypothetical protein
MTWEFSTHQPFEPRTAGERRMLLPHEQAHYDLRKLEAEVEEHNARVLREGKGELRPPPDQRCYVL